MIVHRVLLDIAKYPSTGGSMISSRRFSSLDLSLVLRGLFILDLPWTWGRWGSQSSLHPLSSQRAWQAKHRMGQAQILTPIAPLFPFPSWILFDEKNFEGDQHILSEGEFPTLTAMGCLASTVLGSLQKVPLVSNLVWVQATP